MKNKGLIAGLFAVILLTIGFSHIYARGNNPKTETSFNGYRRNLSDEEIKERLEDCKELLDARLKDKTITQEEYDEAIKQINAGELPQLQGLRGNRGQRRNQIDRSTFDTKDKDLVSEALKIALADEFKALNTYELIQKNDATSHLVYDRIIRAEQRHIESIQQVMTDYGIAYDEYKLDSTLKVEDSLEKNLELAIKAEEDNIKIYENLLTKDYPEYVKSLFNRLLNGSQRHLEAFKRTLENPEEVPCQENGRGYEALRVNRGQGLNQNNNRGQQRGRGRR